MRTMFTRRRLRLRVLRLVKYDGYFEGPQTYSHRGTPATLSSRGGSMPYRCGAQHRGHSDALRHSNRRSMPRSGFRGPSGRFQNHAGSDYGTTVQDDFVLTGSVSRFDHPFRA